MRGSDRRPLGVARASARATACALCLPAGALAAVLGGTGSTGYRCFAAPRPVVIRGYAGDAMEPFISRDGRYLLFNNLNQAPAHTTLRWATRIGSHAFLYRGQIRGANDAVALTGVPTMSGRTLFFISPRSYTRTLSTVYRATLADGLATGVRLVTGVVAPRAGIVDFDVEVDAGGRTLYVSEGEFGGAAFPTSAKIVLFRRARSGYTRDVDSDRLLAAVNRRGALTYAASISTDDRELFFTQIAAPGDAALIYRAVRSSTARPFGHVQRVSAITGLAEAPSVSADGRVLYYHRRTARRYAIYSVTRKPGHSCP